MPEIHASVDLDRPAAWAWERIGDFAALHTWHPAITAGHAGPEPGQRTVTTADGRVVVEQLVDEGPLTYTYAPVDPTMGLPGYRATISVTEAGPEACVVDWHGSYDADTDAARERAAQIAAFYRRGLENI